MELKAKFNIGDMVYVKWHPEFGAAEIEGVGVIARRKGHDVSYE